MAQYIDKAAVVAEIKSRININETCQKISGGHEFYRGAIDEAKKILSFLDTLEVKEVDNVWHDANEIPKGAGDKQILVQFTDYHASVHEIDDWEYLDNQTKWAYLKDLT